MTSSGGDISCRNGRASKDTGEKECKQLMGTCFKVLKIFDYNDLQLQVKSTLKWS